MGMHVRHLTTAFVLGAAAWSTLAAEQPEDLFRNLYGGDYEAAKKTRGGDDDVALAKRLVIAARDAEARPELMALLCEKAYELGLADPEGYGTAVEAMEYLAEGAPDRKLVCRQAITEVFQQAYLRLQGHSKMEAGANLVQSLLAEAALHDERGDYAPAISAAEQAVRYTATRAPELKDLARDRLDYFRHRRDTARKIEQMSERLKASPDDYRLRNALVETYVIDWDAPQKANELLTVDCDPKYRTYVPLAAGEAPELSPTVLVELGDWYRALAEQAQPPSRPAMLQRAHRYYSQAAASLPADGPEAVKVKLAQTEMAAKLKALGLTPEGEREAPSAYAGAVREMSEQVKAFAAQRDALPPQAQCDLIVEKMKEIVDTKHYVAIWPAGTTFEDGKVVELNFAARMTTGPGPSGVRNAKNNTLDLLWGLPLRRLSINGWTELKGDLSALAGMKLEYLDLGGCRSLESLDGIQGMPLETLILPDSPHIRDVSILRTLPKLKVLTVAGPNVRSIEVLRGMGLEELELYRASVATLRPLAGMKLKSFTIRSCRDPASLDGLQNMPLQRLTLDGWGGVRGSLVGLNRLGLSELRELAVTNCGGLVSLQGVEGLGLTKLSLYHCGDLRGDLRALKGMQLTSLDVTFCEKLQSLSGVQGMPLEKVSLSFSGLVSLDGLQGSKIEKLQVGSCQDLLTLKGLEGSALRELEVVSCSNLRDVSGLAGTKLQKLTVRDARALVSLRGLEDLPLTHISITQCPRLVEAEYMRLARIPTLIDVQTGNAQLNERILTKAATPP